jgi:hypothetical protein
MRDNETMNDSISSAGQKNRFFKSPYGTEILHENLDKVSFYPLNIDSIYDDTKERNWNTKNWMKKFYNDLETSKYPEKKGRETEGDLSRSHPESRESGYQDQM